MTDVNKAIERVLELDEKAIDAPWQWGEDVWDDCIVSVDSDDGVTEIIKKTDSRVYPPKKPEADLIIEYRALCPALARALKIAIGCFQTLTHSDDPDTKDMALGMLREFERVFE
jgi:hypothetical protein